MANLAKFNFKLSQLYPGAGNHHINTCRNPDCSNFGPRLTTPAIRRSEAIKKYPDITPEQIKLFDKSGSGAYNLSGASKKYRRVSDVFEYENDPHVWSDQRTVKCLDQTRDGKACGAKFSILSPDHLDQEVERLRNQNTVLDGPACVLMKK